MLFHKLRKNQKIAMAVIAVLLLTAGIILLLSGIANSQEKPELDPSQVHYFYGQGCPHCAVVDEFFTESGAYENYPIVKHEIYGNPDNAVLLTKMFDYMNVPQNLRGVPAVFYGFREVRIGDTPVIRNFDSDITEFILAPADEISSNETPKPDQLVDPKTDLTVLAVTAAAFVDSINPCAFAVLILLMTSILAAGTARKAFKAGLLFALAIFLSYLAMGLGLYQALALGNFPHFFIKAVGVLAVIIGLLNLKDYFWYGKGFLMEVPQAWRPKMKSIIQSVTSPLGAFGAGFIVSLFLLPCTSGPYIVILGMLSQKQEFSKAVAYLVYYNLIFVLPMVLITLAVYKGLDPKKAEAARQGKLRLLHLIAGIILILMGLAVFLGWL